MSWREALSKLNPFDFANADPADFPRGFDPDAFMTAIEDPRPLFLQDCENAIQELLRSSGEAA